MEKITLSLHNTSLKEQLKAYAQKSGLSVSGIVENYLSDLPVYRPVDFIAL